MLYQNLVFPTAQNGYYNYDHSIKPIIDPGANAFYFWSIQFSIQNGDQGYMGLQTDVLDNNGHSVGKGANVAMWGATNATTNGKDSVVRTNTDGALGNGLYMPYEWTANTAYRMRIWQDGSDDAGFWWQFWIKNESTGIDTHIGNIYNPLKNYIANSSVVWTEYYGPERTAPCDSPVRKPEVVMFLNPTMNNDGNTGSQITPVSSSVSNPNNCPNYCVCEGPNYTCTQSVTT